MSDYLEIARQVAQSCKPQSGPEPESLETVLKRHAIELWCDVSGERFWLVADEADAAKLGQRRGAVYTAAEARRILALEDPAVVREIHEWKRQFDGTFREVSTQIYRKTKRETLANPVSNGSPKRRPKTGEQR